MWTLSLTTMMIGKMNLWTRRKFSLEIVWMKVGCSGEDIYYFINLISTVHKSFFNVHESIHILEWNWRVIEALLIPLSILSIFSIHSCRIMDAKGHENWSSSGTCCVCGSELDQRSSGFRQYGFDHLLMVTGHIWVIESHAIQQSCHQVSLVTGLGKWLFRCWFYWILSG